MEGTSTSRRGVRAPGELVELLVRAAAVEHSLAGGAVLDALVLLGLPLLLHLLVNTVARELLATLPSLDQHTSPHTPPHTPPHTHRTLIVLGAQFIDETAHFGLKLGARVFEGIELAASPGQMEYGLKQSQLLHSLLQHADAAQKVQQSQYVLVMRERGFRVRVRWCRSNATYLAYEKMGRNAKNASAGRDPQTHHAARKYTTYEIGAPKPAMMIYDTHTHTHTHARTHARTHAHARTHTHDMRALAQTCTNQDL